MLSRLYEGLVEQRGRANLHQLHKHYDHKRVHRGAINKSASLPMQEVPLLIHLIFTVLECYALLIGDVGVAALGRCVTLSLVAWCHYARRYAAGARSHYSPLLTSASDAYYTQLLYLFMGLDLLAYPFTLVTLLVVAQWRRSTPWLCALVAILWLQAFARIYAEKQRLHVTKEPDTTRDSV